MLLEPVLGPMTPCAICIVGHAALLVKLGPWPITTPTYSLGIEFLRWSHYSSLIVLHVFLSLFMVEEMNPIFA